MATPDSIAAQKQLSMAEDGFMVKQDAALGRQVSAMVEGHIPVQSTAGFTLLKHTLKDNAVREPFKFCVSALTNHRT